LLGSGTKKPKLFYIPDPLQDLIKKLREMGTVVATQKSLGRSGLGWLPIKMVAGMIPVHTTMAGNSQRG